MPSIENMDADTAAPRSRSGSPTPVSVKDRGA